jgi:hypothetical protein
MKKIIYIIIFISAIVISTTTLLFANLQIIKSFKATNNNDIVTIEWETISEKNISRFELQRLSNSTFKTIHSQKPKGDASTYKFTDSDGFIKEITNDHIQTEYVASYKIKIIYTDNSPDTYTDEIYATRNVSIIKRTLGMLKEMFK